MRCISLMVEARSSRSSWVFCSWYIREYSSLHQNVSDQPIVWSQVSIERIKSGSGSELQPRLPEPVLDKLAGGHGVLVLGAHEEAQLQLLAVLVHCPVSVGVPPPRLLEQLPGALDVEALKLGLGEVEGVAGERRRGERGAGEALALQDLVRQP